MSIFDSWDAVLCHHGIKGQKWGIRRFQNEDGSWTTAGRVRYGKNGDAVITSGSNFFRVGKDRVDVNRAGGLYVSSTKSDANRYIRHLGPTFVGRLFGNYGTHVQTLVPNAQLKAPSVERTVSKTLDYIKNHNELISIINDNLFSSIIANDGKNIGLADIKRAENDYKQAKKIAAGFFSLVGDGGYSKEVQGYFEDFRKSGYDVIPDLNDRFKGLSETASIIINPSKITLSQSTAITKETMKKAKEFLKNAEKLKVDEIFR